MIYQSNKMELECIRTVFQGKVNDIYICKDLNTGGEIPYTLLVIKDHNTARKYLQVFEQAGKQAVNSYIDSFSDKGDFCMLFEYRQERPIMDFYMGTGLSLRESEEICINLILQCMESALPYPVLYLILQQRQIHLAKDGSIYWSYYLDLKDLDEKRSQKDCVLFCAILLKELLESKASSKGFTYRILEKKIRRESYGRFVEIYRDLKLTASPRQQKGFRKKIKAMFGKYQEVLHRIFFTLCTIVIALALLSLVSQLFLGEIPWLRILFNGFKKIGTQSLLQ